MSATSPVRHDYQNYGPRCTNLKHTPRNMSNHKEAQLRVERRFQQLGIALRALFDDVQPETTAPNCGQCGKELGSIVYSDPRCPGGQFCSSECLDERLANQ